MIQSFVVRHPIFTAVSFLLTIALRASSAEAQTDGGGNSGYGVALTTQTVTRTLPNGQAYVPRAANLDPNGINFQDCEENITLDFDITETVPSAVGSTDVLQVWAGPSTTDCTSPTARETPGPFCWQVAPELEPTPGTSVTVAIAARSITEYLELNLSAVPGGGGVVGGPNLPESACHTQTSSGPVAVVVYFMFLAPGSSTVDASASYPLNAALVGPLAPTAVTAGIGDGVLIVDWTTQIDPTIQGFYIYAEDQGPQGTAGGTDAGATLENDIYCHNGADAGDYSEVLDAASLEALGEAGLAARGCERAFPVSAFTAPGLDGGTCSSHALVSLFSTSALTGDGGTTEVAGGVGISAIDYSRYGAATVGVGTSSEVISTIPTADGGTINLVDGHQYAVAVAAYDQDGNVGLLGPLVCQTPEPIRDFFGAYSAAGGQGGEASAPSARRGQTEGRDGLPISSSSLRPRASASHGAHGVGFDRGPQAADNPTGHARALAPVPKGRLPYVTVPPAPDSAAPVQRGPRLRIVHINDVYSLANLPRFATLVRHYGSLTSPEPADALLVVLAGDFVAPSVLSSLDCGRGMVECLNAAGVTHLVLGNHEDDIPMTELHKRIAEFRGTWLSTNVRELDPALPAHQVIVVRSPAGHTARVGLLGVVMTDDAVYHRPPFGGAKLWPANESVLREADLLRKRERCDLVIPITHQSLADDRALIRESTAEPFPLILGGHEHDVHVERDLGTFIIKAGSEAEQAAIVEITWGTEAPLGPPEIDVRLEPVAQYEEALDVAALVALHMKQVDELERAVVLPLAPGESLSSVGSRSRQVSLGTLVCSRLRDSFGADTCILNGGGIRGGRDYSRHLAFGDIKEELPFDNEMVMVNLPGAVLGEAIIVSRALAPQESGGFLQVDDEVAFDATTGAITEVAGAPFDPTRDYRVVTVRAFFSGMDHEEPLVRFASANPHKIPPATSGRELKEALLEAFALELWRKLGGFEALDADGDGLVTAKDIERALTALLGEPVSQLTVTLVLNAVDKNHDHQVSREESALADGTRTSSLKKRT